MLSSLFNYCSETVRMVYFLSDVPVSHSVHFPGFWISIGLYCVVFAS